MMEKLKNGPRRRISNHFLAILFAITVNEKPSNSTKILQIYTDKMLSHIRRPHPKPFLNLRGGGMDYYYF